MSHGNKEYQFKALSDIWTGDGSQKSDRLILTGLLGSIRWWFEVLVRGLGGSACDPTKTQSKTQCKDNTHCVACELFGCTGWARKFRFEVLNDKGDVQQNQIKKDDPFILRFIPFFFILRFIPLRPIRPEEWVLLETSLRLIAEYGAIGGKTVFKPSEQNKSEQNKKVYHNDYGLIKLEESQKFTERLSLDKLEDYLSKWKGPKIDDGEFTWASLQNFWFVEGKYLTRKSNEKSSFNRVIGIKENKKDLYKSTNKPEDKFTNKSENKSVDEWLAGSQQESKKVFSFKNPARTFGFVKPGLINHETMKQRLEKVWENKDWKFLCGEEIIKQLFAEEEKTS